ncbi:Zinc finger C3HC-type 1 [Hyphodiscus hymeniophilus]|uniref:Zinc finger C3HC-type 1 n=1 Tax=Hyphodiscus hymeniophilus TaxID=353542 RepID=A0A9P6SL07_9HELO|nr:Zinc finger C3HC-type 1 [Hyphodiscus hymeniophilus]
MNATKRKFNALLNGIGNKSTTSLASKEVNKTSTTTDDVDDDPDTMLKRRRLAPPASTLIAIGNAKNIMEKTKMSHKKSASHATNLPIAKPPKYAPWDRVAFLERLKSFNSLTDWTPKPARVNEVEWAKRGWVCQKSERVRCCLCNVEILVKLNQKMVDGKEEPVYTAACIEEALVDKYVELIITSHTEDCLWRKRGCDDTIFKLPLNDAHTTLANLRGRYDELCLRKDTLPYDFNLRLPESFFLDTILSYLPPNFFTSSTETISPKAQPPEIPEFNKVAFQLALFGWQGSTHPRLGDQLGTVTCTACFRQLGLWLFKSKGVDAEGVETEVAICDCLDTVEQHRPYCPWRNAISQNGSVKSSTSDLAGWEIVMRVLKNDYYLRTGGGKESRPVTAASVGSEEIGKESGEEDEALRRDERDAKDKERWARLRRVKSLFDTKATKKLQPAASGNGKEGKGGKKGGLTKAA